MAMCQGSTGGLEGSTAAQGLPHTQPWEGGQVHASQGHTEAGSPGPVREEKQHGGPKSSRVTLSVSA